MVVRGGHPLLTRRVPMTLFGVSREGRCVDCLLLGFSVSAEREEVSGNGVYLEIDDYIED